MLIIMSQYLSGQDSSNIKKHLSYLGSDLFEGRGTGSIGGELAAKYIAINLNKYELTPMGYEKYFFINIFQCMVVKQRKIQKL